MIHLPTSKTFKEAAAISYMRSIAESSCSPEEDCTLAEFQKLAMAKIRLATAFVVLYFVAAMAALVSGYIVGTPSLLPAMNVFLLLTGIEIASVALHSQLAYIIPVHISYFRPKEAKAFMVRELNTPVYFKKYALGLAIGVWILSLFWYEYCTSTFQCKLWWSAVSLVTAAAIWYLIMCMKGYAAVSNAIMRKKHENEQWLREH